MIRRQMADTDANAEGIVNECMYCRVLEVRFTKNLIESIFINFSLTAQSNLRAHNSYTISLNPLHAPDFR